MKLFVIDGCVLASAFLLLGFLLKGDSFGAFFILVLWFIVGAVAAQGGL